MDACRQRRVHSTSRVDFLGTTILLENQMIENSESGWLADEFYCAQNLKDK
tara:strand:- start:140 stop:292 length:153 start_codon:yes stop_codon:yes gene_type:complete